METKGVIYVAISAVLFSISAILVKLVSVEFNSHFVSTVRFAVGIILGLVILYATGGKFRINDKKTWILRGITGSVSMVLYYMAIQMTNSGRATLLNNMYIFFVAIFGALFFDEKMQKKSFLSIPICLVGVTLVFYDGSSYPILGDIVGLLSAVIVGMSFNYTKKASQNEHPIIVYLAACIIGLVFAPFSVINAEKVSVTSVVILIGVGVFTLLAQIFMTSGVNKISAVKGSLVSYLKVPFTIIMASFIGEEIGWRFYAGTVILIFGLLIESGSLMEGQSCGVDKKKCNT